MSEIRFVLDGQVRTLGGIDPTDHGAPVAPRQRSGAAGRRRAAPRGTAAPARWCWPTSTAASIRYRAVDACLLFLPALDGPRPPHGGEPVPPRRAAPPGAGGAGRLPRLAVRLLHAGLRHGAHRALRERAGARRASGSTRCWPGTSAAAPATGPSWTRRRGPGRAAAGRGSPRRRRRSAELLGRVARAGTLTLEHAGKRFLVPRTLDEAARLAQANPGARLLAGGTDLGLLVTKQQRDLGDVVSLAEVAELHEVAWRDDGAPARRGRHLHRGAAGPRRARTRRSAALVRRIASVQIRNVGTVAGNLCQRLADRRHAAGAPGARRLGGAPARRRRAGAARSASFFTGYRKTALEPGEFIGAHPHPAAGRRRPSSAPTRWPSGTTRTSRRCSGRLLGGAGARPGPGAAGLLRRHGGHPGAGARGARRRWSASPGPRRRWRRRCRPSTRRSSRSPTCAAAPATGARWRATCCGSSSSRRPGGRRPVRAAPRPGWRRHERDQGQGRSQGVRPEDGRPRRGRPRDGRSSHGRSQGGRSRDGRSQDGRSQTGRSGRFRSGRFPADARQRRAPRPRRGPLRGRPPGAGGDAPRPARPGAARPRPGAEARPLGRGRARPAVAAVMSAADLPAANDIGPVLPRRPGLRRRAGRVLRASRSSRWRPRAGWRRAPGHRAAPRWPTATCRPS